jgi:hypothetical protein
MVEDLLIDWMERFIERAWENETKCANTISQCASGSVAKANMSRLSLPTTGLEASDVLWQYLLFQI